MGGNKKGLSSKEDSLNSGELANLLLACETLRDKVVVYGMAYAGLRVSELVHLRRTWINWEENTLTVPIKQECSCWECNYIKSPKNGIWKPKTKHGARTILVHPQLIPVLKEFLEGQDGVDITRQRVWQRLKILAKNAIIRHNTYPHGLRATCASNLAHDNISSPGLQYVLGWARLSSAESYVRTDRRRALKEQDEIYSNIGKKGIDNNHIL